MPPGRDRFASDSEALLVGLARTGDRTAFEELVRRRQPWIRNLMRRFSGDVALADDLSQQVFLQAWRSIRQLQQSGRFGAWIKQIAVNTWLQHLRRNDPLRHAAEHEENTGSQVQAPGISMDLDRALAKLAAEPRLCIVLAYHAGMSNREIADHTGIPLGTVKSHIRRGTQRLQEQLADYLEQVLPEESHE